MRWLKVAAIAGGVLIAFLVVSSVVGFIFHVLFDVIIAAAVVGAAYVAIKMARSNRQVSRGRDESEIREQQQYRPLPRTDVEPFLNQAPTPRQAPSRQAAQPHDVEDELARLKREMGG